MVISGPEVLSEEGDPDLPTCLPDSGSAAVWGRPPRQQWGRGDRAGAGERAVAADATLSPPGLGASLILGPGLLSGWSWCWTYFPSCCAFLEQEAKIVLILLLPFSCGKIHVNFIVRGSRCVHNTADDAPSGSRTVVPRGGPARWSVSPHRAAAPVPVAVSSHVPEQQTVWRPVHLLAVRGLLCAGRGSGLGPLWVGAVSAARRPFVLRPRDVWAVSGLGLAGGVPLGCRWSAHGLHAQRWDCRGHARSCVPH